MKAVQLSLLLIFCFVVSNSQDLLRPAQRVLSANEKFLLVYLYDISDLDDNLKRARQHVKGIGLTNQQLSDIDKELIERIKQEKDIRKQFPIRGVYEASSGRLMFEVKASLDYIDEWFVSNDGSLVVGLNSHVVLGAKFRVEWSLQISLISMNLV